MDHPFVSLADQQPLSAADWQRCTAAAHLIRSLLDNREQYIQSSGIDRDVWMPAANWNINQQFYRSVGELLGGNTLTIELLRLYAQQFSGHALWAMSSGDGQPLPPLDRGEIEDKLRDVKPDNWAIQVCRQLRAQLPERLRISPPARFGEVGWRIDDVIVNRDTASYWERLLILYRAGFLSLDSPRRLGAGSRVLEIGGGYGALAWYLQEAIPELQYTIVDLPESLAYSAIYLDVLHPGATRFCANYEFPALVERGEEFDLVINTLSMSEMSERQVRAYCEGICQLIRGGGVFFEQNQDNASFGMLNAQDIVGEYFSQCEPLGGPANRTPHLIQGYANVWSAPKHR